MTSPIFPGDDDEPDWDNLVTRDRSSASSSASEPWMSIPTRGRSHAVDHGHALYDVAHARLGAIYLFSKIYVDEEPVWMMGTRGRSSAIMPSLSTSLVPTTTRLKETVSNAMRDLVKWIKQKIDAALKAFDAAIEQIIETTITKAIDMVMSVLSSAWEELSPIAGNAMSALEGLSKTFTNAKALFDSWITSKGAQIIDGHPKVIVESLRNAMTMSLLKGLYDTVKAGLALTGEFVSMGLSKLGEKIVGAVAKAVEWIVSTILKARERAIMQKFFGEAEAHWNNRSSFDGIHTDHEKFVAWFKPPAMAVPSIAAIALLSHICGDKSVYLSMYQGTITELTQTQFTTSATAIDSMKGWAKDYLRESGYAFSSSDKMVGTLLSFPTVAPTEVIISGLTAADAGVSAASRRL